MSTSTPTTYPGGLTRGQVVSWRNAIFVTFLLVGLAMASWASRLPSVRDVLDIRIDEVGILILGVALGSTLGLVASSHVVARFGAKRAIAGGLIVVAIGIAITGVGASVPTFALTFAGLLVFGASSGLTDVSMNVSGAANERALGRSIMPIFHAFFSFGTMIGAALGALAEQIHLPIVIHLAIIAVIITIGALLMLPYVQSEHVIEEESTTGDTGATPEGWRTRLSIWRDPRTLFIGLIVLAAAFAEGSANDWLTLAMVDGHDMSKANGALVFGVFLTAMTAGRLGGVFLLDRFGRVTMLRASFLLAAVGLLIIIFVPNPVFAVIGVIAWGLGSALGFPIGMSAAADDPKTAAARVSAVATIGYFAFLVGPPVIGFLGAHVGLLNALLVVLVLVAAGSLVASKAREPGRVQS